MAQIVDRPRDAEPLPRTERGPARPVLLATLSVPVAAEAERVAIESALDAGAPLIIANMIKLPVYPTTMVLARGYETLPHEEALDEVRDTAARVAARGVRTELLRISSPRPISALLELTAERRPGLLVLGPDVHLVGRWRFRVAARRVRREASCLVWIAPDG